MNVLLRRSVGGMRSCRHPLAPFTLHFDGYRNVGWNFEDPTAHERELFTFAERILAAQRADCAWDIGANVGLWTLFLAGVEPRVARIVAYEPDEHNLRLLYANIAQNDLAGRVAVRQVALSDTAGTAMFHADSMTGSTGSLEKGDQHFIERYYGGKTRPVQIQRSTGDADVAGGAAPPPQFVKIDVEGHELALLRGMSRTLATSRPVMLIEVTSNHAQVGELLREAGYQMFDARSSEPIAVPTYATAALPAERHDLLAALQGATPKQVTGDARVPGSACR